MAAVNNFTFLQQHHDITNFPRWLGHLYRCEESNPCKKLTLTQSQGVRKRRKTSTEMDECRGTRSAYYGFQETGRT
jgi:hypothetical protein